MTSEEAIYTLSQWQWDMMHSDLLLHVCDFTLSPQATGFYLNLEYYSCGTRDSESIFGDTILIVIEKGVKFIREKREELKAKL